MANANTFGGFQNLPTITLATTAETLYKVPAVGNYPGLPSPSQIAANWLVLPALAGDVNGGALDAGRPFRIRVNGEINNAQSETITIKFYNVTAAGFAAGPTATNSTGVSAAMTTIASGAVNGKTNFFAEMVLVWDSQSKILNGYKHGSMANTVVAETAITAVTALAENDLNFAFTVTAGTTGTGDVIGPVDFVVERF